MAAPEAELVLKWEREQAHLRESVKEEDTEDWQRSPDFSGLERVGGVDLSFIKGDDINACAHLVVLTYPHMKVLFVDGNGLFHYREFGLACHLGVLSDLPCVGVAKNLLHVEGVVRSEEHQLQINALQKSGDSFSLATASGRVLGKALRSSQSSIKPVYVSVGHRITLDTAVRLTHTCCLYRVPEPIRQADIRSREYLRCRDIT
ncbi:endonuclease V-like isoform X3 [Onychostoma macrolepis]|uniref:endonuclease V-like isoform X3 n=1 Tax=Onychostoma macrolepis TaxID=369639 RepID=UPI00272AAAF5|nr:endonuclease V-like isoform X3 [Onychostoma macrolepis]